MVAFSGSPTVNAPVTLGYFHVDRPDSVRTRIREALAWGIKNRITKANGFNLDIGEVHVNAPANDNDRKVWPSVDILWLPERYINNIRGENSLGGFNKIGTILIEGHLFENQCDLVPEDIVLKREMFIADMEKYFGIYYYIPDSGGVATAANSIPISNTPFGIKSTEPKGGVEFEIEVYYRIEQADPTQDF
jgi:hypothetical protein